MQLDLEIKNLSYTFEDGTEALRSISLSVKKGEALAVMGPNGAGKSTLLWLLMGAFKGFSGSINICGSDIGSLNGAALYKKINLVFQNPENQMFCDTVEDEIAFALDNLGAGAENLRGNLKETAAALGVSDLLKKEPQHLSFGQKKRVALASVMVIKPDILLLDEPSSNLDFSSREKLVDAVNGFTGAKMIVTQDIHFALSVSERLVYMDNGAVIYDGSFKNSDMISKCPVFSREIADMRKKLEGI